MIDPDIPDENQRVFFEAENAGSNYFRWELNGVLLAPGEEGRRWEPRPGRYALALTDLNGKAQDTVVFEVRGRVPSNSPNRADTAK